MILTLAFSLSLVYAALPSLDYRLFDPAHFIQCVPVGADRTDCTMKYDGPTDGRTIQVTGFGKPVDQAGNPMAQQVLLVVLGNPQGPPSPSNLTIVGGPVQPVPFGARPTRSTFRAFQSAAANAHTILVPATP